jgi:hypothetical protein
MTFHKKFKAIITCSVLCSSVRMWCGHWLIKSKNFYNKSKFRLPLMRHKDQYCGSGFIVDPDLGSTCIRFYLAVLDLDPDTFVNAIRIQEHGNRPKFTNEPDFLPFKKLFYLRKYVF